MKTAKEISDNFVLHMARAIRALYAYKTKHDGNKKLADLFLAIASRRTCIQVAEELGLI